MLIDLVCFSSLRYQFWTPLWFDFSHVYYSYVCIDFSLFYYFHALMGYLRVRCTQWSFFFIFLRVPQLISIHEYGGNFYFTFLCNSIGFRGWAGLLMIVKIIYFYEVCWDLQTKVNHPYQSRCPMLSNFCSLCWADNHQLVGHRLFMGILDISIFV